MCGSRSIRPCNATSNSSNLKYLFFLMLCLLKWHSLSSGLKGLKYFIWNFCTHLLRTLYRKKGLGPVMTITPIIGDLYYRRDLVRNISGRVPKHFWSQNWRVSNHNFYIYPLKSKCIQGPYSNLTGSQEPVEPVLTRALYRPDPIKR